jgi:hypothetical protein
MNWINQKIIKFNRVPLGRNRARPRCTVRARPTASAGAACAAQLGRPAQHAAVTWHGAARWADGGTAPAHGRLRGTAAHRRGDDGAAWRRRVSGERREVATDPGIGGFGPRRSGRRHEWGERSGGERHGWGELSRRRRHGRGELSGCAARCPDSSFNPRRRRGARRLTGGARSSVISELKITPKENSSKQIARNWEKFWKIHGGRKLNLEHFS